MEKEKSDRPMNVMVRHSLYEEFSKKCNKEHRTVSEVLREFMSKYVQDWIIVPKGEK
jgi:predicted CopG family antitoxin